MAFGMARALALLLAAGAAEAVVYKCDNNGRPAFTGQPGPGCEPIEVKAPEPSRDEVQRETQRWTLKQEDERARAEEAEKARQEQAEKNRDQELQNLQRELQRRNAVDSRRQQPVPMNDSTLEEGN